MSESIKRITIKGFKSIESLVDFELRPLNVLIGENGSGKSNFVDFFRMLRAMADGALQKFVTERGGADGFFYMGPKYTSQISVELEIAGDIYRSHISPTASGRLMFAEEELRVTEAESVRLKGTKTLYFGRRPMSAKGQLESLLARQPDRLPDRPALSTVSRIVAYHLNDTSSLALLRRDQSVRDSAYLRDDASNIAAFLLGLRETHEANYGLIRDVVRLMAPFLDDFLLEPKAKGEADLVRLEWRQKGSDFPFQSYQLSDGTIRFICLATALLQPNLPAIMLIDEPELGLHPYAIELLAGLIQSASKRTQMIVSTQSPALLDNFGPEDTIVVNREDGHSTLQRLDPTALREWLAEYTLAELWQKNVLHGGTDQ